MRQYEIQRKKKNPEMFPLKSLTQQRRKKRIPQEIKRQTRMTPLQKFKKKENSLRDAKYI